MVKLKAQSIHSIAITDDNMHHISSRCSSVEAEALKLRVKVIGVFPKLCAQFGLTGAELERLQKGRDHHWRQRTGVNIRMRVETQISQCLLRSRDKPAKRAERVGGRSLDDGHRSFT